MSADGINAANFKPSALCPGGLCEPVVAIKPRIARAADKGMHQSQAIPPHLPFPICRFSRSVRLCVDWRSIQFVPWSYCLQYPPIKTDPEPPIYELPYRNQAPPHPNQDISTVDSADESEGSDGDDQDSNVAAGELDVVLDMPQDDTSEAPMRVAAYRYMLRSQKQCVRASILHFR
jgi:hypothetical protein